MFVGAASVVVRRIGRRTWRVRGRRRRGGRGQRCAATARQPCSIGSATLTYAGAGCDDPVRLRADLAGFFRGLRGGLGGGGSRMRGCRSGIRAGTATTSMSRSAATCRVARSSGRWGHGFFLIKLIGDLPVGSGSRREARSSPAIWPSTSGKSFEDERRPRGGIATRSHRASSRRRSSSTASRREDVIERASGLMGAAPERVWFSSSVEGWHGPPACWAQWA